MEPDTKTMQAIRGVAERSIERARTVPMPPRASELSRLQGNVDRLYTLLRDHAVANHKAGETNRLTAEAIAADRAKLRQTLEQEGAGLISESKQIVDDYRRRLEDAIQPANAPSEERLTNARADAKLALDGAPVANLFAELHDLATEGEPAIRHLLLFTPWVDYYTRNRNALGMHDRWLHAKRQLMVELLTEDGMRAYQSLDTAADLAEVPARMTNALTWYVKDLPKAARKAG